MYTPHKKHLFTPWLLGIGILAGLIILFQLLRDILTPFIVAAVLAYILNPLVNKLQRFKLSRSIASMFVMFLGLLVVVALLLVIVPMLVGQIQKVVQKLPQLAAYGQHYLLPWINERFGDHIQLDTAQIAQWLARHAQAIQQKIGQSMPILVQKGSALASGLSNIVLLPLLLYYFLLDWARWGAGIRNMIPRRYLFTYNRISGSLDKVLSEFLRGQLMVMLIMGSLYGSGLALVGLDSGFAIGMVAGLLVFVPYLGAFTGLLLATLAASLQYSSWHGLVMVWLVFAVGQFAESFFITPKIVGDRIGLSPFWVIFALMAFGSLLGFIGMLVALPLAAVCLVLLREAQTAYVGSSFYRRRN